MKPLTEERKQMVIEYMTFAENVSASYGRNFPQYADDLRSSAMLALVQAASVFDASRGVNFVTFAKHRVVGALKDFLRSCLPCGFRSDANAAPQIHAFSPSDDQRSRTVEPPHESLLCRQAEAREQVESWIGRLPRWHSEVCHAVYLEGTSLSRIAQNEGGHRDASYGVHRESLALIRSMIEHEHDHETAPNTRGRGC